MDALPADDRVLCNACRFLVASARCRNWRAADLTGPQVGGFAELPQRCPGHAPLEPPEPQAAHTGAAQSPAKAAPPAGGSRA